MSSGIMRALSAVQDRLRSVGMDFQFKGKRDMAEQLGYERDLEFEDFLKRYERHGLAAAIVEIPAKATWRRKPRIFEPNNEGGEFQQQVDDLMDRLDATSVFQRADIMNRIGQYSVIFIGTADTGELRNPIAENGEVGPEQLMFMSPFHQDNATIRTLVEDETDPMFGAPELYDIDFFDPDDLPDLEADPNRKVHASRIIHVAEGGLESELVGRSSLERVWNLLDDVDKIGGGSAEMFWQNVSPIFHGEIPPDFDIGVDEEEKIEDTEDQMREMMLGLRQVLITQGMELDAISGPTPDPRGVWEVLKSLISASTNIPQRVLFGSEEGDLASTQDKASFLESIRERQVQFAEPVIVRPWVERMQAIGALPDTEFKIEWPDLFELTDLERSEVQQRRARAIRTIAPAGATDLLADVPELRAAVGLPERPEDERPDQPIQDGPFEVDREVGEVASSLDVSEDVAARLSARARAQRREDGEMKQDRDQNPQGRLFTVQAGAALFLPSEGEEISLPNGTTSKAPDVTELMESASGTGYDEYAWAVETDNMSANKSRLFSAEDRGGAVSSGLNLAESHHLERVVIGELVGVLNENPVYREFAVVSRDENGQLDTMILPGDNNG